MMDLQRRKGTETNRPQLEVLELRGEDRLDIFGIACCEQPVPSNMRREGKGWSTLLSRYYVESTFDEVGQFSSVIRLYQPEYIDDSQRVWTW
jgi:hypothetical protein